MKGNRILLFIISLLTWLILSWSLSEKSVAAGIIVSIIVALVAGDLFTNNPHKMLHLKRYLWFFAYTGRLFWDMFKANFDVLRYMVVPYPRPDARILEVPIKLTSGTGITALANTITLISGMATVDISDDERILFVHVLRASSRRVIFLAKIRSYEKLLEKIFEEK